jgi:hypothetical protein
MARRCFEVGGAAPGQRRSRSVQPKGTAEGRATMAPMYWPFIVLGVVLIAFGWWMPNSLRKARHIAANNGGEPERLDALLTHWWMRAFPYFATVAGLSLIIVGLIG